MAQVRPHVRPAAVAGLFYPAESSLLDEEVSGLLREAPAPGELKLARVKALIVPHAGYIYSGAVAASAYRLVDGAHLTRRVVLVGPAHRVWIEGLALPGVEAFSTPLGVVPVDEELVRRLSGLPQVTVNAEAHAFEHSLEVHLPFLQHQMGEFSLLPLLVGGAKTDEIAEVLERVWGGPETLIVISSDLSHYLPYVEACRMDKATAAAILALHPEQVGRDQACGNAPVRGLLTVVRKKGLIPRLLDLRNSGDTRGPQDEVVGYGAFAFLEPDEEGDEHEGGIRS